MTSKHTTKKQELTPWKEHPGMEQSPWYVYSRKHRGTVAHAELALPRKAADTMRTLKGGLGRWLNGVQHFHKCQVGVVACCNRSVGEMDTGPLGACWLVRPGKPATLWVRVKGPVIKYKVESD